MNNENLHLSEESFSSTSTIKHNPSHELPGIKTNHPNRQKTEKIKKLQKTPKLSKSRKSKGPPKPSAKPKTIMQVSKSTKVFTVPNTTLEDKNRRNSILTKKGLKFGLSGISSSNGVNLTINFTSIPPFIPEMNPKFLPKKKIKKSQKTIKKNFCEMCDINPMVSSTSIMNYAQKNRQNKFNNSKRCILGSALKREMLNYNLKEDNFYGVSKVDEEEEGYQNSEDSDQNGLNRKSSNMKVYKTLGIDSSIFYRTNKLSRKCQDAILALYSDSDDNSREMALESARKDIGLGLEGGPRATGGSQTSSIFFKKQTLVT